MGEVVFCHNLQRLLKDLPQLNRLVICRKEVMRGILPSTPLNLVYLLFYFQGLEVVELGLMRLEFGVELVLASLFLIEAEHRVQMMLGAVLTVSFLSKSTTLPPLSPVAR